MKVLGIIPARGGSKGVRRKNVRLVAGRPLLAYTIDAARKSTVLDHFVVSTDDAEIADVARSCGAEVCIRPPHLAEDTTPALPVIEHLLNQLDPHDELEALAYLQPTAPLRGSADIDGALRLLQHSGADSVVSVYRVEDHHPTRMYRLIEERLQPYADEPASRLRQELPDVYHRNGAVYACRRQTIDQHRSLIGPDARPWIMPRERSVNIDDELDLAFADFLLSQHLGAGREVA